MKIHVVGKEEESKTTPTESQSPHPILQGDSRLKLVPALAEDTRTDSELGYTELKKRWCNAFEKEYLVKTLKRNEGNVSAAARDSKLDRSNFLRLLRRHKLKAEDYRVQEAQVYEHKAA